MKIELCERVRWVKGLCASQLEAGEGEVAYHH